MFCLDDIGTSINDISIGCRSKPEFMGSKEKPIRNYPFDKIGTKVGVREIAFFQKKLAYMDKN